MTKFTIHYSYKNSGCTKKTKRSSTYHSIEDAKKAAKRFLDNGYKLVNSLQFI